MSIAEIDSLRYEIRSLSATITCNLQTIEDISRERDRLAEALKTSRELCDKLRESEAELRLQLQMKTL